MDRQATLEAFDDQLRRNPQPVPGTQVERTDRIVRIVAADGGWSGVVWSDLGIDADAVIAAEAVRFEQTGGPWEWKHYSYDQPVDLPARLVAAGLAPDQPETVLVAEIADLALEEPPPVGVRLVPVVDAAGVEALVGVHDEVFGGDHAAVGRAVLSGLARRPSLIAAVLAEADGRTISSGRLEFHPGTDFASLWGGGTVAAWRGRGVFRSLVAYRAALARERGFRYLQVDATPDSRPILQRLGFVEIATTTAYQIPGAPE
ncbi:MAG: GNAT family N-acetyltransferase [Geodermatophilaceae bacterium]